MSDRLLWFLVGAGAVYLFVKGGTVAGLGGSVTFGFNANANAAAPPDQRWQENKPDETQPVGVWDPMGNPTYYKDIEPGSYGNKIMSGGGSYS